jgi:hypothetical protein
LARNSPAHDISSHVAQFSFQRHVLDHDFIQVGKNRCIAEDLRESRFLHHRCRFDPERRARLFEPRNTARSNNRQIDSRPTARHHRCFERVIQPIAGKRVRNWWKAQVVRTRFDTVDDKPRKSSLVDKMIVSVLPSQTKIARCAGSNMAATSAKRPSFEVDSDLHGQLP